MVSNQDIANFIEMIWNMHKMNTYMFEEQKLDKKRMPIGRITQMHITKCYRILRDLQQLVF